MPLSIQPEQLLAHRDQALVLDEITELVESKRASGLWTPTDGSIEGQRNYFEGHFPENPVLPGHWTVESVAQIGGCILLVQRDPTCCLCFVRFTVFLKGLSDPGTP